MDGANAVTTVHFQSGVTNADALTLQGGNTPSGAVTNQTDGQGRVIVSADTTSQGSFGVAGSGDLNLVNVDDGVTFNIGHDLATRYLNLGGFNGGSTINQTAGTITVTQDTGSYFRLSNNTTYTQSGTGVLNARRISLGAGTRLTLQNQGSGLIYGNPAGSGTLIFAGDYDTDSSLGTDLPGGLFGGRLASITVNDGVTLTLDQNASATTFNIGQGASGVVNQSAATLTATTLNINDGAAYNLSGTGTLNATTITVGDFAALNVNQGGDTSIGSTISGAGGITKAGTGTLTLSGTNTYSGGTAINNGAISVSGNASLGDSSGTLSFDGGTLQTTASFSTSRATTLNAGDGTFSVNAGTTLTHSGQISGTGTLIKTGSGTLILSALNNNYTGGTVASQGTLRLNAFAIFPAGDISNNATVEFNLASAGGTANYFDIMSGTGNLIKTGTGLVNLFGANTYTGGTTISDGILNIAGTAGSIAGDIVNNSQLVFGRSNAYTHAGNVSGTGVIEHFGIGTTSIIGDLTHTGGTTISDGILQIGDGGTTGSITGDVANNSTLAFNRSDALTFGGVISGTGGLLQNGSGNLNLTGINTYSGTTTINSGILSVNGSIASSTATVNTGGTLGGAGTVGSVTINGGTLAPGNSIGTLNIAGNVDFSAGGTYAVEVDAAGNSDWINATGTATLTNGTVSVTPEPGSYDFSTNYTILTAAGGLGGTSFDSVSSSLAFLTPTLSYDANNVLLNLRRNNVSFSALSGTPNQTAVGIVIDELNTTSPGTVLDLLNNLFILTADGANQAYDSLSGVQHTHGNHIALQSTSQFKGLLFDRVEGNNNTLTDAGNPLLAGSMPAQRGWWLRGTGNYGEIDGTSNASGAHYKAGGIAAGLDVDLTDSLTAGAAFGYTRADVDVAHGGLGIDTYQAALYGRLTLVNDYYLTGMTGLGYHDMDSNRRVTVGPLINTAKADYDAWTGNIAVEGGREIALSANTSFTPFAGLEYALINRDSFIEKDGGVTNLRVDEEQQESLRSSLGVRIAHNWIAQDTRITPAAELAWVHELMHDDASIKAGFAAAPTTTFSVDGPELDRDRARLALGLDVQLSETTHLNLGYQGEFASSDERHDVAATLKMVW
mgnify:FL=1